MTVYTKLLISSEPGNPVNHHSKVAEKSLLEAACEYHVDVLKQVAPRHVPVDHTTFNQSIPAVVTNNIGQSVAVTAYLKIGLDKNEANKLRDSLYISKEGITLNCLTEELAQKIGHALQTEQYNPSLSEAKNLAQSDKSGGAIEMRTISLQPEGKTSVTLGWKEAERFIAQTCGQGQIRVTQFFKDNQVPLSAALLIRGMTAIGCSLTPASSLINFENSKNRAKLYSEYLWHVAPEEAKEFSGLFEKRAEIAPAGHPLNSLQYLKAKTGLLEQGSHLYSLMVNDEVERVTFADDVATYTSIGKLAQDRAKGGGQ